MGVIDRIFLGSIKANKGKIILHLKIIVESTVIKGWLNGFEWILEDEL